MSNKMKSKMQEIVPQQFTKHLLPTYSNILQPVFSIKRVFKLALLQIKVYFEKVKGCFYLESETHSIINMIIM